ncbi:M48 family metalloprotease [Streptomyces sp. CSDS2]|uniref:M48 family metalloprotease n=1 Tax=Streptomyces sp. CSDS2 TaxID=3055051 RepID=UPI0025B1895D|nr:M48 family metalloprotease [Streptomyces sp. CSDS2]MDN3258352.1 M48 family metalloprotease [Streptomyces sp. CSDS2]
MTHPPAAPEYPEPPRYPQQPPPAPPVRPPAQPPYPPSPAYPTYPQPQQAAPYAGSDPSRSAPPVSAPPNVPPPPPLPPSPPGTGPRGGDPHDPRHPHHISTEHGRIHLAAQQRRTDATAVGSLLLHLPNFLGSLFVVGLVSLFFGGLGFLVVLLWLASGALIFHRPTESALARHVLRLRYPTPQERAKLEPVWREVTARAGVDGRTYELWVEDSDHLNAVAAAGHIVGVTRFAMERLPNGELAAVMAHELGHHVGGHAWAGLLGYWYALPGRLAWRLLRSMTSVMYKVSRAFSCFGIAFFGMAVLGLAYVTISSLYGLPLLILGVPYALAAVGRRAELRADQHAAALGFAPMLAAVLGKMHEEEQQVQATLTVRNGGVPVAQSPLARLLTSHPDYYTRLHHLQPYLAPQGH